jgi:outer membrane immunogenic protein
MRLYIAALFTLFALGSAPVALAQSSEIAVDYSYMHANAPPGNCACFSMNGGGVSYAYSPIEHLAVVADFNAVTAGNVNSSGLGLTLFTYMVGPRFTYPLHEGAIVPFAQVLVGGFHASGSLVNANANASAGPNGFAMEAGGGLDIPVGSTFSVRAIEADYLLTTLPNGVNARQNNLRLSAGVVWRF